MILQGDSLTQLKTLPDKYFHACVTSPPYWGLRDYGVSGQMGLEQTPQEYVEKMVELFREVRRTLRDDGTLWLNLGDSYNANYRGGGLENAAKKQASNVGTHEFMATKHKKVPGLKPKDLVGIPWRVAFALQSDGWYLRQDIIWHKPNPMPESVRDRCTKAHEYIFLLSKRPKYYFDADAIRQPHKRLWDEKNGGNMSPEGFHKANGHIRTRGHNYPMPNPKGANKRTVWSVSTRPYKGAHFATFPQDLIEPCILAGSPESGLILDPFFGAGTTGLVAAKHGRGYVGIELNPEYIAIAEKRLESA